MQIIGKKSEQLRRTDMDGQSYADCFPWKLSEGRSAIVLTFMKLAGGSISSLRKMSI